MNLKDRVMSRAARRRPQQPSGRQAASIWADPLLTPGPQPTPTAPFPGVGPGSGPHGPGPSGNSSFGPPPGMPGPRYRLAEGAPAWGRFEGSGVEPPPGALPQVDRSVDRIASINAGTPAQFRIDDSAPAERGLRDFLGDQAQWDERGRVAVNQNDEAIRRHAADTGIDADLLRAVVFMENARGYYGRLTDPVREQVPEWLRQGLTEARDFTRPYSGERALIDLLRKPGSVLPANINPDLWHTAGLDRRTAYEPERNIEAAATVLRGLIDRTPDPTPAKIASMWHFTGSENVDHFGELVGQAYRDKPWQDPAGPEAADRRTPPRGPAAGRYRPSRP